MTIARAAYMLAMCASPAVAQGYGEADPAGASAAAAEAAVDATVKVE